MKARLKPWREANAYSVGYRVVILGKTIGFIARQKTVPFGMRNDWSCTVINSPLRRRGPDLERRGDAKRWVAEHYVP